MVFIPETEKRRRKSKNISELGEAVHELVSGRIPEEVKDDTKSFHAARLKAIEAVNTAFDTARDKKSGEDGKTYLSNKAIKESIRALFDGGSIDEALIVAFKVDDLDVDKAFADSIHSNSMYWRFGDKHSAQAKEILEPFKAELQKLQRAGFLFSITDLNRSSTPFNLFRRIHHHLRLKKRSEGSSGINQMSSKDYAIKLHKEGFLELEIASMVGKSDRSIRSYLKGIKSEARK
jgi:hypothetical protein